MALRENLKTVIIGCGISGIAAAQRLIKAGFQHVRILEATERAGGRIKTGEMGEQGLLCSLKGPFFLSQNLPKS